MHYQPELDGSAEPLSTYSSLEMESSRDRTSLFYAIESRLQALERLAPASLNSETAPPNFSHIDVDTSPNGVTNTSEDALDFAGSANFDFNAEHSSHNFASAIEVTSSVDPDLGVQEDDLNFDDYLDFSFASYAEDTDTSTSPISNFDNAQRQQVADANTMIANATMPANMLAGGPLGTPATAPAALPPARLRCITCNRPFHRTGDLNRHALKHNPNARRYACPEPTCRFSGLNGMVRKDKMKEHRARHGH
ncbi:uncharacterized protein LY89DRAFT_759223 [Mollisia scopiformis]|uniref:C2H2-type domain-containing protein n=1 Tax=Mollisia scopiformis TaxID=149040 RepID=A0A194WUG0_MOLSC|nr:uncharacterized protein LY89DRAFT_759223 [Mollisia scopiformis]KUJ11304.1 hypothetical protein LY89DRAFT_759223 [Mollisia scopiformis]